MPRGSSLCPRAEGHRDTRNVPERKRQKRKPSVKSGRLKNVLSVKDKRQKNEQRENQKHGQVQVLSLNLGKNWMELLGILIGKG